MSKARQLANLGNVYDDGALSSRNMVINGAMLVNQRGNRSPTGFSGGFYAGPDRWYVNRSGTGSTGFSQISSTSYGGTKAAQATFLCASGETYIVTQRIEANNIAHLAGETVTLSFWASGSSDAGSATLEASLSYAGAVDDFTSETVISSNTVSYSGSAQRFTFTFTLPANAANGVAIRFDGAKTSATGTFTLTFGGVQLEVGDTATPFEHRSYGDELQKCQRYFYKFPVSARVGTAHRYGVNGAVLFSGLFPVEMRAIPTMASTGTPKAYNATFSATYDLDNVTNSIGTDRANFACAFQGQSSGLGTGEATIVNLSSATFTADAEL